MGVGVHGSENGGCWAGQHLNGGLREPRLDADDVADKVRWVQGEKYVNCDWMFAGD